MKINTTIDTSKLKTLFVFFMNLPVLPSDKQFNGYYKTSRI